MLRSVSRRRKRVLKLRTDSVRCVVEVEFVREHQGPLHAGAHRAHRHRGAGHIDDVLVYADRIVRGFSLVLGIEPLAAYLAAFALAVDKDFDVENPTVRGDADDVGDGAMFSDCFLDNGIAIDFAVTLRLEAPKG